MGSLSKYLTVQILFFINLFIYLGLRRVFAATCGLLIVVAYLVVEHRL